MIKSFKAVVSIDGDGHFNVSDLNDKKQVIENLKNLMDGDTWANEIESAMEYVGIFNEDQIFGLNEEKWVEFVKHFEQRGMMEIKELNQTINE